MRNAFTIISCLTLAVLLVNAQDDTLPAVVSTPSYDPYLASSSSFMNLSEIKQETTGAPSTDSVGTTSDSSIEKIDDPLTENITVSTPMENSTMTVSLNTTEDGGMSMTDAVAEVDDPLTVKPFTDLASTDLAFTDLAATDLPLEDLTATDLAFTNLGATDSPLTDMPLTDLPVDTLNVDTDVNTKLPVLTLAEKAAYDKAAEDFDKAFENMTVDDLNKLLGGYLNVLEPNMTTLVPELEVEVTDNSSRASVQPSRNFSFLVYDDQIIPCTLASMSIKLKVQYTDVYKDKYTKEIEVPENVRVTGTCGDQESNMTLFWMDGSANDEQSSITFKIVKDHESFYVNNVQVQVFLDENKFPHTGEMIQTGNSTRALKLFSAPVKDGIHVCQSQTEVDCGKISVLIKDVSLVAFNDKLDVSNRKEKHCPFKISMASILGGIIGTLVVICIVSSIIWYRKRSNNYRSELP